MAKRNYQRNNRQQKLRQQERIDPHSLPPWEQDALILEKIADKILTEGEGWDKKNG